MKWEDWRAMCWWSRIPPTGPNIQFSSHLSRRKRDWRGWNIPFIETQGSLQFPINPAMLNRGSVKLESGVCKTPICCNQVHLLKNRYEEPNNMILYDIIRYHNPPILPQGGVSGGTIFFEVFLPGCWCKKWIYLLHTKKGFGSSKNLKIKMVREKKRILLLLFFSFFLLLPLRSSPSFNDRFFRNPSLLEYPPPQKHDFSTRLGRIETVPSIFIS